MNGSMHKIAVVTDDVEGAVEFYTTVIGMQVSERFANDGDEDFVFLKSGEMILELMPQKTMGAAVGFHHISFRVDSVDATARQVQDRGVALTVAPVDAGVGGIRVAFFQGPNDLQLQLFQRDNTV
jgi:lactoylglutathione lyase